MDNRTLIQNTLDYIEENIKAHFTTDDLCRIAGYSNVHYCRLFQHYVGLTPNEYILRRKLLYSIYDMSNEKRKIDSALNYGFESYSGFYKAFKREFHCSPSDFLKFHKGTKPYRLDILQEEHIMISKNKIHRILDNWDLSDKSISIIRSENTGVINTNSYYIGDNYVLKFSANLGNIKKSIDISNKLLETEIPVAKIIKTTKNTDYLQYGELYFILTKRINGNPLKCKDVMHNANIAFAIGENIARLHNALKTFEESDYKKDDLYNDLCSALSSTRELVDLNQDFIDNYTDNFGAIYSELPKQIIHRDINPSNMMFDNKKFNGFLDFELTEVNIRIFDICYCATSILSECFTDNDKKDKWIEAFHNIVKGYDSINSLSDQEKMALPYVIYSIQLICISYFSKLDKYEHLTKTNIEMLDYLIAVLQ